MRNLSSSPFEEFPDRVDHGFAGLSSHALCAWLCVLISVLTISAYLPVLKNGFIVCDDPDYVTQNQHVLGGLSWDGVRWAMTSMDAGNWHPVTWLSHMLDVSLFGTQPGSHHAMSLGIHVVNACMLFILLKQITRAHFRSAFVAAFFAIHPLHVESVAWASERKDVLSALFGVLSLVAYARHVLFCRITSNLMAGRGGLVSKIIQSRWYWAAFTFLALGLMSKPMLVSWPLVMLTLDYWPLARVANDTGRVRLMMWRCLLLEKVPFIALVAISCVITVLAQHKGGAVASMSLVPLGWRWANAIASYFTYLAKTVCPFDLAAYYPLSGPPDGYRLTSSIVFMSVVSGVAFLHAKKRPCVLVGWLWYLVTLLPVIGVVQVGMQSMADRYTYIPLIGIFVLLVWSAEFASGLWKSGRMLVSTAGVILLGGCFCLTHAQVSLWKDSISLYSHTLRVTRNNSIAHLNLGSALLMSGRVDEAAENFSEAIRIRPEYAEAVSNLGFARSLQGRLSDAEAMYRRALVLKPQLTKVNILLASVLEGMGRTAEAVREFRVALKDFPENVELLNNLSWYLATCRDDAVRNGQEAVSLGEKACRLSGDRVPQYIGTLAAAYAEAGRFDDAIRTAEKARDLAAASGLNEIAKRNAELLQVYNAGKPFRETNKSK